MDHKGRSCAGATSLRKHPFLLALRRGGRFFFGGETDVFAAKVQPFKLFPLILARHERGIP